MHLYICELKVKKKTNEKNKITVKHIREINEDSIMPNVAATYFLPSTLCMNTVEACIRRSLLTARTTSSRFMGAKSLLSILSGRGMFSGSFSTLSHSILHSISRPSLGMRSNFSWNHSKCVARTWRLWNWSSCIQSNGFFIWTILLSGGWVKPSLVMTTAL